MAVIYEVYKPYFDSEWISVCRLKGNLNQSPI